MRYLHAILDAPHELLHRIRRLLSPAYADMAALARDQSTLEFLAELRHTA